MPGVVSGQADGYGDDLLGDPDDGQGQGRSDDDDQVLEQLHEEGQEAAATDHQGRVRQL